MLLQLQLPFFLVLNLVRDGAGRMWVEADGGSGGETEMNSRQSHGASARQPPAWWKDDGLDDAAMRLRPIRRAVAAYARIPRRGHSIAQDGYIWWEPSSPPRYAAGHACLSSAANLLSAPTGGTPVGTAFESQEAEDRHRSR